MIGLRFVPPLCRGALSAAFSPVPVIQLFEASRQLPCVRHAYEVYPVPLGLRVSGQSLHQNMA